VFVTYDELLTDWRAAVGRIADGLGFQWPTSLSQAEEAITAFLSTELRHHASPDHTKGERLAVHAEMVDFYVASKSRIAAGDGASVGESLATLRHNLESGFELLGPVLEEDAVQSAHLANRLAQTEAQLVARSNELAARTQELSARDAELQGRTAELQARGQELEARSRDLATRDRELNAALGQNQHLSSDNAALRAELSATSAERDVLLRSRSWRFTFPLRVGAGVVRELVKRPKR
jgi:hypothetical protein